MATLEQLIEGLRKADAAGNADDARAFAAEIRKLKGATPEPEAAPAAAEPDTSLTQQTGVVARSLAPYATAAGVGAAMGAPAGGIGAIPGAIAGIGALGLGDLGVGAYNLARMPFGGEPVRLPSDAIRDAYGAVGVGRKPATPEQALGAAALEGGANAMGLVGAGRTLGGTIGNWFAARPAAQVAGGVGGAATPTAMREYGGVESTPALVAGSLAGGIGAAKGAARVTRAVDNIADAGYRSVTGGNISSEGLRQRAQAAFNATDASGVTYEPTAIAQFATDARRTLAQTKYDPTSPRHVSVNAALDRVDEFAAQPQTIGNLHSLRQDLNFIKKNATNADAGRMIDDVIDGLDDFVAQPTNATAAGAAAAPQAAATLKGAISDWAKLSKADVVEGLIERAQQNTGQPLATALQAQFKTLANNPRRLARFDENERAVVKEIAGGGNQSTTLTLLSQLAPSLHLRDLARTGVSAATGAAGLYTGSLPLMATAAGMSMAGLGARAGRNAMAQSDANALAAAIRRGDVRAPARIPAIEMMQRGIPQAILQAQQPADYYR